MVAKSPGLLDALQRAIEPGHVSGVARLQTVSWFLLKLGCAHRWTREDPRVQALVEVLGQREAPQAARLQAVFKGATSGGHGWG